MKTANGPTFVGLNRNGVIEFRGVFYGKSPSGHRRFRPPEIRYYSSTETLHSFRFAPKCATNYQNTGESEGEFKFLGFFICMRGLNMSHAALVLF